MRNKMDEETRDCFIEKNACDRLEALREKHYEEEMRARAPSHGVTIPDEIKGIDVIIAISLWEQVESIIRKALEEAISKKDFDTAWDIITGICEKGKLYTSKGKGATE